MNPTSIDLLTIQQEANLPSLGGIVNLSGMRVLKLEAFKGDKKVTFYVTAANIISALLNSEEWNMTTMDCKSGESYTIVGYIEKNIQP